MTRHSKYQPGTSLTLCLLISFARSVSSWCPLGNVDARKPWSASTNECRTFRASLLTASSSALYASALSKTRWTSLIHSDGSLSTTASNTSVSMTRFIDVHIYPLRAKSQPTNIKHRIFKILPTAY